MDTKEWLLLGIFFMLALIAFILVDTANANAESHTGRMTAVVSFDDAEQLAAISDSIVGVCDTTVMTITRMEEGHSAIADSFRFVLDTVGTTITCRELVCVTVVSEKSAGDWFLASRYWLSIYDPGKLYELWKTDCRYGADLDGDCPDATPGTAIITWREVKR